MTKQIETADIEELLELQDEVKLTKLAMPFAIIVATVIFFFTDENNLMKWFYAFYFIIGVLMFTREYRIYNLNKKRLKELKKKVGI